MKLKALKRSALVATLLASFVAGPVTSFAQPAGVDASVEQKLSIATQGELATLDSALYLARRPQMERWQPGDGGRLRVQLPTSGRS